ncbi:MAG: hypothetical protein E3J25_09740 [Anaerolineales bacterium]|nr:MAG: hypothetical protein E3J25_09740 [Anaerolineales bacterium]
MGQDVAELVEPYLSDDPIKWGKLASDVQWRRLQLLLLREILVELRKLNSAGPAWGGAGWQQKGTGEGETTG